MRAFLLISVLLRLKPRKISQKMPIKVIDVTVAPAFVSFPVISRVVIFSLRGMNLGKAFQGRAETVVWRSLKNLFIAVKFCHPCRASKITKGDMRNANSDTEIKENFRNLRISYFLSRISNSVASQKSPIVGSKSSPR